MRYKCKITVIDKKVFPDLQEKISDAIKKISGVHDSKFRPEKNFTEIFTDRNSEVADEKIIDAAKKVGEFEIKID